MSENIEKAVQTEESSETKGTDNVVLYPVSDEEKTVSAAQETSDTESKATDGKTADNTNKFNDTQNTKEASPKDAEEEDDADPGPLRQGGAGGQGQCLRTTGKIPLQRRASVPRIFLQFPFQTQDRDEP